MSFWTASSAGVRLVAAVCPHHLHPGPKANPDINVGLTTDDSNPLTRHENRHDMWQDYNHAWLALLQRQKDMMESGQQLGRSQTLLSQESLEHLGRKLIEMGDKLEKHGLVDYERGVWEERIVNSKSSSRMASSSRRTH
jgi:hypothetical protein